MLCKARIFVAEPFADRRTESTKEASRGRPHNAPDGCINGNLTQIVPLERTLRAPFDNARSAAPPARINGVLPPKVFNGWVA